MWFDVIFVSLFVLGWLICGYVPWLAKSIVTRGNAGLKYLPLCLFAGVVAGLAVPIVGFDGRWGFGGSFAAAAIVSAALLAIRPPERCPQ